MIAAASDNLWKEISDWSGDFQAAVDTVISSLEQVNSDIFHYACEKGIVCGSTVSILLICGDLFAVINAGDSPVYYADAKTACHASTEHSYDVIMQKSMNISPDELDKKRKGKLVQAVGVKEKIYPNVRTGKLIGRQTFLLCSDGISRYFTDKLIFKYLKRTSAGKMTLKELTAALKEQVYRSGAKDNLSEIAVLTESGESTNTEKYKIGWIIFAAALIFLIWAAVNLIIIK
jgi:serine/threonine protein phosphatase PrpC